MRKVAKIRAELRDFQFDADAEERMESLAAEIESHSDGAQLVADVLQLYERYPGEDFGMPGALAHAIENFSGQGYEDRLIESLQRCPTMHTLWLANRVRNAEDEHQERFTAILTHVAQRKDLSADVVALAKDFLE